MVISVNLEVDIKKDRSRSMGRSTRFFGGRVLRSGRRVWTGPITESFGKKSHCNPNEDDDELVDLKSMSCEVVGFGSFKKRKTIGRRVWKVDQSVDLFESEMRVDVEEERGGVCEVEEKEVGGIVDKMFGIVYRRKGKRKREKGHEDRYYFRRKKRRGSIGSGCLDRNSEFNALSLLKGQRRRSLMVSIVVGSCGSRKGSGSGGFSSYWVVSSLLHSVLGYLRRADVRLLSLCAFVCSKPFVDVFAAHGVRFLKNFSSVGEAGSCIITGVRSSIPVFSVNFGALPFVFLHLHSCLSLWSTRSLFFSETNLISSEEEEELNSVNDFSSFIRLKRNQSGCEFMGGSGTRSQTGCEFDVATGMTVVALPALRVDKVRGQSVCIKNGSGIQKKRNSLRKKGRSSSISLTQKSNGISNIARPRHTSSISLTQKSNGISNILRPRHNGIQFPSQISSHKLRSSNHRKVLSDVNGLKSPLPQMTQKIGANSCSATILVVESDKCYRVEGALTTLELSESNRWCLTIRKDGVKRSSISAQKIMRPYSNNRFTHNIIWSRDNDLKLEFPNRQDWLIFKELYMECFERNMKMPVPSFIPVPGVNDVDGYGEIGCLPFVRPHYYVSVKDDELTRALKKRTANYDMDSDDEEYLRKFNSLYNDDNEVDEYLSAEHFELIIDAFEKACYCNPDIFTDAEAPYRIFPDLGRKLVEAVYGHWVMKRKLKRAALVRVFQCYQPRKSQLISKFNSRKKRSFKRSGSQAGRGKQRSFFHAFVGEQDNIEQQNLNKVQKAKATLERLESLASQKRRQAQELFENAELASYKALMALRISEAAQLTESTDVAASYILDQTF